MTTTETIVKALRIVASGVAHCPDAERACRQAADRLEELEAINAKLKENAINTTQGLAGIRTLIRRKEYDRAILWCSDTLSGHTESADATLLRLSDQRNDLVESLEDLLRVLPAFPESASGIIGVREKYDTAIKNAKEALALAKGE